MKILKPGKVEQRKFVCPNCGCIFLASLNELETDGLSGTFSTICPNLECGEHITDVRGEPYEEPAPTQTDRGRLREAVKQWFLDPDTKTADELIDKLIAHGVTFREDA